MATFKEKYGGERGVCLWLKHKLSLVKKPLGCCFSVTAQDLTTKLLVMKVSLKDFIDFLEPMSEKTEPGLNEGFPRRINSNAAYPDAFYCDSLKLRWGIVYKEEYYDWIEIEELEAQFNMPDGNCAMEFDHLAFTFEDRELLEEFLESKTRQQDKIYRTTQRKLECNGAEYGLNRKYMPFWIIDLAYKNSGKCDIATLSAKSGRTPKECLKAINNLQIYLRKKFRLKPASELIKVNEREEWYELRTEFFVL